MTASDILAVKPARHYTKAHELSWFVMSVFWTEPDRRILAQRWSSVLSGEPDVWVAVPEVVLTEGDAT